MNDSTIATDKKGRPLFYDKWPLEYQKAWRQRCLGKVEKATGLDLRAIISEAVAKAVAKIKADRREKKPTQRELYAQWDREAKLAEALNGAIRNLQTRAVAPVRRTK